MNILNILKEVMYVDIKFPFGYWRDKKIFEKATFFCQGKEFDCFLHSISEACPEP